MEGATFAADNAADDCNAGNQPQKKVQKDSEST